MAQKQNAAKGKAISPKPTPVVREIARNKRAHHDIDIKWKLQAGLKLYGWEIKAIRAGKISSMSAFVTFHKDEAWLTGLHIEPLIQTLQYPPVEPDRSRKLLLTRREIRKLRADLEQKGTTGVLLRILMHGQWAKADIGIGLGKKRHDKRRTLADKDWKRRQSKSLKRR